MINPVPPDAQPRLPDGQTAAAIMRHEAMVEMAVGLARSAFAKIGWAAVPEGKAPNRHWKSDATDDPALVPGLLHGARNSLVIPVGRAMIIDVDDPSAFAELAAAGLPATLIVDSPTPGNGHAYAFAPPGVEMSTIPGTFAGGEIRREVDGVASMVLGPWSRTSAGVYVPRDMAAPIATLPVSVVEYLQASKRHQDATRSAATGPGDAGWTITSGRHDFLVGRARNLRGIGLSGERLVDELIRLDRERCRPSLADVPGRGTDEIRSIAAWVKNTITDDPPPVTIVTAGTAPFNRTDAGNGEFFARVNGDRVRYDHRRRRWLIWAGHWWRDDDQAEVRRLAVAVARERFHGAVTIHDPDERKREASFAIGSENRQRLEAMLKAAESEPSIRDAGDRWDADPWLLGVANGVVDLRTGVLRAGLPDDRITRHTGIAFDPAAACPRWERFLREIFCNDDELIDYIARAVGYSLTGATSEQCVFMGHGLGANGKTVFLTVLRNLAGQYAFNAPFSTFEEKDRSSIPNDLAALAGRRLVTASETNEGSRLNEARLKALTGGDPITARFLNNEWFTYQPLLKLWLAVNHRPEVRDDSYGFWRRVRLIPFLAQFRDAAADPGLIDTLRAELAGILAWAVRGAVAWQQRGLEPPAAVTSATEAYRVDSDPLAGFIADCCVVGPDLSVVASEVYRAYKAWAEAQGLSRSETLSNKLFGARLAAKFQRRSTNAHNLYVGIGLRTGQIYVAAAAVEGQVEGQDRADGESQVSPIINEASRENSESASTTLHAPPLNGSPQGPSQRAPVHAAGAGDPAPHDPAEVPAPDGAHCPTCSAGPFVAEAYYTRHWQRMHGSGAAATAANDAGVPPGSVNRSVNRETAVPNRVPDASLPIADPELFLALAESLVESGSFRDCPPVLLRTGETILDAELAARGWIRDSRARGPRSDASLARLSELMRRALAQRPPTAPAGRPDSGA